MFRHRRLIDRITPALPCLLLVLHAGLQIVLAGCHAPVFDEIVRIDAGIRHWDHGDLTPNPGNPPLNDLVAAIPIMLLASDVDRKEFTNAPPVSEHALRFTVLARLILIPLSALGGWICYCWAADLVGRSAALVTLALWCFDPMILSHGALVTGDMPATVAGLAAMYSFFVWVTRPSARLSFVCGVTLGLALLTKFVWVVLPVAWMILWLPCRLASRAAARPLKRWQEVGHILLVMLVCLYVINAGFGFAGAMQSLDEYRFQSDVMQFMSGENAQENAGWAVQWLRRMPIPLPSGYLHGIDSIAHHVQPDQQITYLHGVWHRQPVWCFYIYGLLCKMPCGIWGLFAIAMGHRMWPSAARAWGLQTDLVLWLPALFVLLLASSVNSVKFLQLFLTREPIARAGYSIRIYHLDCQQANEMRAELGLEPIDCDPGRNAR